MAAKRKGRAGDPTTSRRSNASVPDVEALLEQRRREVPQVPGWQEFIDAAQTDTDVIMGDGRVLPRIRYGAEPDDWGADDHPCRDCGAVKGQYHVYGLCGVERCPNCGGQLASCDCEFEGDSGPAEESTPKSAAPRAGGKVALTPAQKAAATRKRKAAAAKAAQTKKRKVAGRKAAATRKAKPAEPGAAPDPRRKAGGGR
jgi:hypothetical protein